jgi:hypothetical protein
MTGAGAAGLHHTPRGAFVKVRATNPTTTTIQQAFQIQNQINQHFSKQEL